MTTNKQSYESRPEANEPTLTTDASSVDFSLLLNWYTYHKTPEDARAYFLTYLKHRDVESFDKLKTRASAVSITPTVGWLCRIYTINRTLFPEKYLKRITDETHRVLQVLVNKDAPKEYSNAKRPTVQENLQNQLSDLLGEIDFEIDSFISAGCVSKFSMYDWLKSNSVKYQQANNIGEHYQKTLLKELEEARRGSCDQLSEAYSFLDKNRLKSFILFVTSIVDDCLRWTDVAKQISMTNKTPRKKKSRPPLKQIEKLQYLKTHEDLKSIPPTQIVGATQLWVYNITYKTLGVYVCSNSHGFMVKGCTILNFDPSESIGKTLRNPSDIIPTVLDSGKVALRKILGSLKTREKKLTGRINKDTILLRAL